MKIFSTSYGQVIVFISTLLLLFGVFTIDINTEMELSLGVLYTLIVLYTWIQKSDKITLFIAFLANGLIFIKLSSTNWTDIAGISGVLSIISVWVTTFLLILAKESFKQVSETNENLNELVENQYNKILEFEVINNLILKDTPFIYIFILNQQGLITSVNKGVENLLQQSEENLVDLHINKVIPFLTFNEVPKNKNEIIEQNIVLNSVPIKSTLKPFFNDQNEHVGYSLVLIDKSQDNKILQLEKRTAVVFNKRKEFDELINLTSHYLQEPVTKVQNVELILKKKIENEKDPAKETYLNIILSAIHEIDGFLHKLQEYAMTGRNIDAEVVNLSKLFYKLKKEYDFINIPHTNLPKILSAFSELEIVFAELIRNAITHNPKNPYLTIDIDFISKKDHYEFTIKDNGIGIPTEMHEKVFEIFKTIQKNKDSFSGLGLAKVKKIMELIGGEVYIDKTYTNGLSIKIIHPIKPLFARKDVLN